MIFNYFCCFEQMRNDVSIIQCLIAFMKVEVLDGDERLVSN